MAIYKLFPSQDASIYSAYPVMNTGLDPILDVANYVTESNPVARVARSIVTFDQYEIENVIGKKINTSIQEEENINFKDFD